MLPGTRLAPVKRTDRVIGDFYTTNRGLKVTWKTYGFAQAKCTVRPLQGFPDDVRPSYCATHKMSGAMENIVTKRCAIEGCKIGPVFGLPDDARPSYCAAHKLPGMDNIVSRRCLFSKIDGTVCCSLAVGRVLVYRASAWVCPGTLRILQSMM